MVTTNKRLLIFESHGDSNRCTSYREKLDQHNTYAFHVSPCTFGVRFHGRSTYVATFYESSTELNNLTHPEKKGFWHNPQRIGWPIRETVPSFSPEPANEIVVAKSSIYQRPATRLTGPISPSYDWYVQYLLMGTNPSVLNRHKQGLPHRKPRNSHNTLPALPFWGFHWSP
jgi:hypothetical protein